MGQNQPVFAEGMAQGHRAAGSSLDKYIPGKSFPRSSQRVCSVPRLLLYKINLGTNGFPSVERRQHSDPREKNYPSVSPTLPTLTLL